MQEIIYNLNKMKEKIDEAKDNIARQEGRLQEMIERLQTEFDCKTLEHAEKLLEKLKQEYAEKTESITTNFLITKEKFDKAQING